MRATRDWFGDALEEVGGRHDSTVVVNCDLGSAVKTLKFKDHFPHRFFECGIAEANSIGLASGLAQEGLRPFVASFGHFLTGKYLEIFQSVGLNDSGVVLVGSHAGLAIGKDGPTQMGLRDVALMRTLPNVEILQPADGVETYRMMEYLTGHDRPSYLRLCRQPQRELHGTDYEFHFGQPDVIRQGRNVAVLTMGSMVEVVLDSVDELVADGIDPTVINVSSLPVDRETVRDIASAHPRVFVLEDHSVTGGLADEVSRALVDVPRPPRVRVWGVQGYGQAAAPEDLYARYQLDGAAVIDHLTAFVQNS